MRVSANGKVRRSAAEWRTLCERFTQSGLGVAEFCAREAIGLSSFKKWYWRSQRIEKRNPFPPDSLQLDVYQLGFHEKTGEVAEKLSFYYLRLGKKESVEKDDLEAVRARVRALCRDLRREQKFRPVEGAWCGSCDFWEFCPAKTKRPRPVPAGWIARQLGFDFEE